MTIVEIWNTLEKFWVANGCTPLIMFTNTQINNPLLNPSSFFSNKCIESSKICYPQTCVKPETFHVESCKDEPYINYVYQVVIKPYDESNLNKVYESLTILGLTKKCALEEKLFSFETKQNESNESILNLTYFVYKIAKKLQNKQDFLDVNISKSYKYGDINIPYYAEVIDALDLDNLKRLEELYTTVGLGLLKKSLKRAAYDYFLKAHHILGIMYAKDLSENDKEEIKRKIAFNAGIITSCLE